MKRQEAHQSDYVPGGKPLTGRKVLLICLLFFGGIASVDALMVYFATVSFSGTVAAKPYEEGLAYNNQIAAARLQADMQWDVSVQTRRNEAGLLEVHALAKDRDGKALEGLNIKATFQSPATTSLDRQLDLQGISGGNYSGQLDIPKGRWHLALRAEHEGKTVFRSENTLYLK